jgi:hypothetical protein
MIAPVDIGDIGAHLYHFTTGTWTTVPPDVDPDARTPRNSWRSAICPLDITGDHPVAAARAARHTAARGPATRLSRTLDDLLWRFL